MQGIQKIARLFAGQYSLMSLLGSNGVRVLLYHHIAEEDNEYIDHLGIRVHPDNFTWQLEMFARDYDVIDLDTALSGKLPKRPLLITFDDAYRTVLDVAAPMLKERGLPGVFFLSSEVVAGDGLMLDNLINMLANKVGVAELEMAIMGEAPKFNDVPTLISKVVGKLPYERRSVLSDELCEKYSIDSQALRKEANMYINEDEVPKLAEFGIDIGCHTGTHAHCGAMDTAAAEIEVNQAKAHLEEMSGKPVRAFSYPYDDPASADALTTIRGAGFEAEFLVSSRAMSRSHKGPLWYRTSVKAPDPKSLFVDIEVMPRLRALRHSMG